MAAVQLMCARLGMVTGCGLASVIRSRYPRWVLWFACALVIVANVFNIGADLAGMGDAMQMVSGIRSYLWTPFFACLIVGLLFWTSYRLMARIFKWLTLVLFAYVAAAFLAHPNWTAVFRATFVPHLEWNRDYISVLVAIALRPLAGAGAYWLFTLGIVGTGMLAVPVLAGSSAYAIAEGARWRSASLDLKPRLARKFYGVIAAAILIGLAFDLARLNAVRMLFLAAVLNGLLAPPLIIMVVLVTSDRRVMGNRTNSFGLRALGWLCAVIMSTAAIALLMFLR